MATVFTMAEQQEDEKRPDVIFHLGSQTFGDPVETETQPYRVRYTVTQAMYHVSGHTEQKQMYVCRFTVSSYKLHSPAQSLLINRVVLMFGMFLPLHISPDYEMKLVKGNRVLHAIFETETEGKARLEDFSRVQRITSCRTVRQLKGTAPGDYCWLYENCINNHLLYSVEGRGKNKTTSLHSYFEGNLFVIRDETYSKQS